MSWRDEFLVWNQSEHGGIRSIPITLDKIWEPGLVQKDGIYADSSGQVINTDFYRIFLYSDGEVRLNTAGYYGSNCDINTQNYPFDKHKCNFNFISFKHPLNEIVLRTANEINLDIYTEHGGWDISDTYAQGLVTEFDGSHLSNVLNTVTLRRKPLFVFVNRYMPLMFITILNSVTSLIPQNCGERISFAVTVYLAFIFMSVPLVDDLPQNSITISLSSFGVLIISLFNTANVIWSVAMIRISAWDPNKIKIPKILAKIVTSLKANKDDSSTSTDDVIDIRNDKSVGKENNQDEDDEIDNAESQEEETADDVTWNDVIRVLDKLYFISTFLTMMFVMIIIIIFWIVSYFEKPKREA
ncbi:Neuronal acetylcholine receptor subunit alpha-7 [Mactra antiquata]